MHIVHLYKDYAPVLGGIEGHLKTLAEGLVRRGFRITVVVCQPQGRTLPAFEMVHGVRLIRLPRDMDIASNAWSFALVATIRELAPDVLHLQMPWPAGDVVARFLPNIPLVVSYQSDVIRQRWLLYMYAPLLRWTLRHARAILVSSQRYAETSPWLADVQNRVRVVPLGIADPLQEHPSSVRISRTLPQRYVLWVGRMRYYKGLDTLIRAFQDVAEPTHLVLVGHGPYEEKLRGMAMECGVADRVIWLGDVPEEELSHIRAAALCFAFPSQLRSEAYGIALLEAIASGIPAISCEIGTATSVINQHGVTGLVIPPNDPAACARAIQMLCDDPLVRARYSTAARARYLAEYGVEKMVDSVSAVYREITRQEESR